jgi:hypothetical protein
MFSQKERCLGFEKWMTNEQQQLNIAFGGSWHSA